METIQELLGSVRDSFFQLIENIIEWFQSLRGTNPERIKDVKKLRVQIAHNTFALIPARNLITSLDISNDKMPDGPASRTRSTSTPPPPEYYIMLKILQKKRRKFV